MVYSTDYTKEEIIKIIKIYTLPYTFSNRFSPNTYISKIKEDKIYLWYAGKHGLNKGQVPIMVKCIKSENKTILKCKKSLFSVVPILFLFHILLFIVLLYTEGDLLKKSIFTFFALLLSGIFYAVIFLFEKVLFKKDYYAVIDFLKEHFNISDR